MENDSNSSSSENDTEVEKMARLAVRHVRNHVKNKGLVSRHFEGDNAYILIQARRTRTNPSDSSFEVEGGSENPRVIDSTETDAFKYLYKQWDGQSVHGIKVGVTLPMSLSS